MEVSERMVRHFGFPKGTIFRIFPVDNVISRMGDDDHTDSFDWQESVQYWFDIIRDPIKGPRGGCQEIRLIDASGRVDMFTAPASTTEDDVAKLWKKILDFPEDLQMEMIRRNDTDFHCGAIDRPELRIRCTLTSRQTRQPRHFMPVRISLWQSSYAEPSESKSPLLSFVKCPGRIGR